MRRCDKRILLLLVVLLCSQCIIGYYYAKERRLNDLHKISVANEINQLNATNHSLIGSYLSSQKYNNAKLNLNFNMSLPDYTLCLYVSENHCLSCVNDILELYESLGNIIPDSNFVIIANFNQNSIKQIKVQHQLKCKVISTFGTNVNIADNKYPCLFIFNKQRSETEMFLFPLRDEPEMLKKYFETVKDKYFE